LSRKNIFLGGNLLFGEMDVPLIELVNYS